MPSSSGGGANTASYAANAAIGVGAGAAVVVAGAVAANAAWLGDITIAGALGASAGGPIGIIAVAVVAIVAAVLDFLGINLFGGGSRPTLPPMLYRFFHYVAAQFLGLLPCLVPNMYDSAAVEAAAPGSGGMGAAAGLPSGGGGGLGGYSAYLANGTAQEAIATAAGLAAYEAANSMSGAAFSEFALTAYIGSNGGEIGMAVAAVAIIVEAVLDAFGVDLFGGGQSVAIPPMYYRFDHYPAGPFIGAYPALFPTQTDSAPQMDSLILARYIFPNIPENPSEPFHPGEGWEPRPEGNFANPSQRQGLHPDPNHSYPKGPHFDWHFKGPPKRRLSIRRSGPGFEWWNPDAEGWQELLPEMVPGLIE